MCYLIRFRYLLGSFLQSLSSLELLSFPPYAIDFTECSPFHLQEAAQALRLSDPTPDEQLPVDSKPLTGIGVVEQKVDDALNEIALKAKTEESDVVNKNENRSDSPVGYHFSFF